MEDSIFAKIVRGEAPCYKIYEDEHTLAFLDIEPEEPGHTLVIPKFGCEKIYDLPDEEYQYLMQTVKKLASHFDKIFGRRTMIKVVGIDVPYVHVHLMPINDNWAGERFGRASDEDLSAMQQKLAL